MDYLNLEPVAPDDEIGRIIHDKILTEICPSYVLVGEHRTCMPASFVECALSIKNFEVRNDDVWLISFPKTGTTWAQEMVWMIANNLNYEKAKESLFTRFPFIESSFMSYEAKLSKALKLNASIKLPNSLEIATNIKSPRFIKTHLPFTLLPDQIKNGFKTPKIVYVWRNPKDACVSYFHHGGLLQGWRVNLETFARLYMADKVMYGSFWKNIFGYWERRDVLNILFISYEEMKSNLPLVIRKTARFLEKELTDGQVKLLTKHLSFESMKSNKAVNLEPFIRLLRKNDLIVREGAFLRSGIVGKYKEELSPETIKKFDEWIQKNVDGTSFEKVYYSTLALHELRNKL